VGVESTIVDLTEDTPRLLRPGGIGPEQLYAVIGDIIIDKAVTASVDKDAVVKAPGMKYRHYAPDCKVLIVEKDLPAAVSYVKQHWVPGNRVLCFDEELEAFAEDWNTKQGKMSYESRLSRVVISTFYSLGLRRSELIGMNVGDVDFGRKVVKVRGKGDKMREIPLVVSLSEEILLYLNAVEVMCEGKRSLKEPLFVTYTGRRLYPSYVDRLVKAELGGVKELTGRKSPHVLRHSLATELMNGETDLNSIKEMLGHSSLAATQVYTHSSVARLKAIYEQAHPRAKNGGKYGN
jgi:site-specific recombinase XerD